MSGRVRRPYRVPPAAGSRCTQASRAGILRAIAECAVPPQGLSAEAVLAIGEQLRMDAEAPAARQPGLRLERPA